MRWKKRAPVPLTDIFIKEKKMTFPLVGWPSVDADYLLYGILALLFVMFLVLLVFLRKLAQVSIMTETLSRIEPLMRAEMVQNREELSRAARDQRQEQNEAFKNFSESVVQRMMVVAKMQKGQLESFSVQLGAFTKDTGDRLEGIRNASSNGAKALREEVVASLNGISQTITKTMSGLAEVQKQQLEAMSAAIVTLSNASENRLEALRATIGEKLRGLQADNAKQLEEMRRTVDEKLQGTLEKRLGESFRQVSDRLEMVHKGLGEMQALATGVGDLKKVLTNVKTRGIWGEVQLGSLLEQVLAPDQFAANVATKGGAERVEFAIRLPGQDEGEGPVWLPVDAKFPLEDYQRLVEAQERGDGPALEVSGKQLENRVRACAADICRKYLSPPRTTDFGILFLPIEGLFAEVIRRTGLTEAVQRESRVVIAGPTTLWAVLSSLQMGFRTLAIQKRSSEVWNLLGAVKTEWSKYGEVLAAVHKKLHQASETIEKAQKQSRAVGRKLKEVQELPVEAARVLLPQNGDADILDDQGGPADDAH